VWEALDDAGRSLLKQTSATTVDVVDHKYGAEAAKTTADGFSVAIDTVETVYNVKQLGVKKIAKRIAKETGKQTGMVQGHSLTFFANAHPQFFSLLASLVLSGGEEQQQLEGPPEQLLLEDSPQQQPQLQLPSVPTHQPVLPSTPSTLPQQVPLQGQFQPRTAQAQKQ
jgi:hypothetical protein